MTIFRFFLNSRSINCFRRRLSRIMRVLPTIIVVVIFTSCLWLSTTLACKIRSCSDCRRCGSTQPGCLSCLRGLASSGKRSSPELIWPSYGFLSSPHHQKSFFSRYADMEYGNFKSQKKESQLNGLR
ncbi:uncharacterized protein LOC121412186 [Lytechinus variegatus]|uniref:uncharacterized protein LOC121412186 n=1 Tax=Lytechinus variegatus TaxID=7654 RepID=UPI001BB17B75|nr:uncharacterized protein LOC121412186 [Lytechinus variegatus]